MRQKRLVIASNEAASKGSVVASPVRKVTWASPSRFALRVATASISAARSRPVTRPVGPTVWRSQQSRVAGTGAEIEHPQARSEARVGDQPVIEEGHLLV